MEFYTAYNRPESEYSPQGSETSPIYEYQIDKKTGKRKLVQTGETNIYEMIQASLESTKIENIIKRFTQGDLSALMVNSGEYIDVSELPTSMIELQNMIMNARNEFMKLDPEIRSKFDNSPEKYVSMYGSKEFLDLLGLTPDHSDQKENTKKTNKKTEEVKEDNE